MKILKNYILPVILAGIWISLSEFFRNELLLKNYWTNHYQSMGLVFPSEPINGAMWGIWSLFFALAIKIISSKFTMMQTTFISWLVGFILMWIVTGNMGVLPFEILYYAIPLSFLECYVAALIIFLIPTRKK